MNSIIYQALGNSQLNFFIFDFKQVQNYWHVFLCFPQELSIPPHRTHESYHANATPATEKKQCCKLPVVTTIPMLRIVTLVREF